MKILRWSVIMFQLILFPCLSSGQSPQQIIAPKETFFMNIDYSRFRYSESEGYLDMYLGVYPPSITLTRSVKGIIGNVIVHFVIQRSSDDTIMVDQKVAVPVTMSDTASGKSKDFRIVRIGWVLPTGTYDVRTASYDAAAPSRKDSSFHTIVIPSYRDTTRVSDVDLCNQITSSDRKGSTFYKNTFEVIPNPSLFFGAAAPVVFSYAELYNLKLDSTYGIAIQIQNAQGQVFKERKRSRKFSVLHAVDVTTINISTLQSGKYRFVLLLSDSNGREIAKTEKPIFIYNPMVPRQVVSTISARGSEFAGMTAEELESEFQKVRYIATDGDIALFKKITKVEGMREFLAKFWSGIESGQHGQIDVTRAIYLDRIRTATQRYHVMGKEGWQTDRGRVYVLYAEPDEIERFPNSGDSKPYEIWHYNQIESGVIFVFVDRSGFGDYMQVHSTKRGELQDDSWQQHLY